LARFSVRVAGYNSLQGKAPALVIKMLERSKNGKKLLFPSGKKDE